MQTIDHLRQFEKQADIDRINQLLLVVDTPAEFQNIRQLIEQQLTKLPKTRRIQTKRQALDESVDMMEHMLIQHKNKQHP